MILRFIQNLFEFKAGVYIVYCSLIFSATLVASLSASKPAHYMMQSGYITRMENIQVVSFRYIALALVIIWGFVGPMQDLWFQSSQVPRPTTESGSLTSSRFVIMRFKKRFSRATFQISSNNPKYGPETVSLGGKWHFAKLKTCDWMFFSSW